MINGRSEGQVLRGSEEFGVFGVGFAGENTSVS